jgi:hypothetical protein
VTGDRGTSGKDPAIRNKAGRTDVQLVEDWESKLSDDDKAVLAALAEADRLTDLDG